MAASFRNKGEITELAGCDNITISPKLLGALAASQVLCAATVSLRMLAKLPNPRHCSPHCSKTVRSPSWVWVSAVLFLTLQPSMCRCRWEVFCCENQALLGTWATVHDMCSQHAAYVKPAVLRHESVFGP